MPDGECRVQDSYLHISNRGVICSTTLMKNQWTLRTMSSFSRTMPRKKTSFLIKDILNDDARERDECHNNFTASSRYNRPLRHSDVHCCERRVPFHGNENSTCSCQQSGPFLGCTVPLSIRIPSPKFPCGCLVSATSRGRWSHNILCCQHQRVSQSPRHLSSLPSSHRRPSPHRIVQEEMVNVKKHTKRNLSDSSIPSKSAEQGTLKVHQNLSKFLYKVFVLVVAFYLKLPIQQPVT